MPNPFPGMDPYLEGDLWTTVHTDLCAEIARQLSPRLRPKYVALSTRRIVLAPPDESEGLSCLPFPDVAVVSSHVPGCSAGAAVASAPLVVAASLPEPIPHVSVEIRDVAERRLVTCIEVLSPTNKRGPGREEYAGKRLQILSGGAHLVEIDLLRVGTALSNTGAAAGRAILRLHQPCRTAPRGGSVADRTGAAFANRPGSLTAG